MYLKWETLMCQRQFLFPAGNQTLRESLSHAANHHLHRQQFLHV